MEEEVKVKIEEEEHDMDTTQNKIDTNVEPIKPSSDIKAEEEDQSLQTQPEEDLDPIEPMNTEMLDDGLLLDDDTNGIEPGELEDMLNESNNDVGDMNVLEAILGDGADTQDDFDKEIVANDSTTKKSKKDTPKAKKTAKPKTKKKTKTTKKTESTASASSKEKVPTATTTEAKIGQPETTVQKPESSQKKTEQESQSSTKKTKSKVADKNKEKLTSSGTESGPPGSKDTTSDKNTATKAKKKKTPVKSAAKKEAKKVEPVEKADVPAMEEMEKPPGKSEEEEALEQKVKELEKIVKSTPSPKVESTTKTESEKQKVKKEKGSKSSSERKRKTTESNSNKDVKAKKGKVKTENADDETMSSTAAVAKEEPIETNATEEDGGGDTMRVVDGYSDHGSEHGFSAHGSRSFSRSYSRSLSGSFSDGSFSVTLSSLSGSHSSLDSIDKEIGEEKKKKKRKKKEANAEKILEHKQLIDNTLKGARYFIIKSNNYENVALSKAKAVWATPPANERKLNDAFRHSTNVILVFSVKESGRFQGFARLASESRHDGIPVPWVLPPGFDRRILGGTFKVDWLNRKEVTFSKCANLRNPWNENKEVKICRDGQELEPSVGEVLCRMFEDDLTVDVTRIVRHSKRHKGVEHPRKPERFKGGRGEWRGGRGSRGGFRGGFRGGRGFNRRNDFQKRGGGGRFREDRGGRRRDNRDDRRPVGNDFQRERSRSPDYRRYNDRDRDSRDRRHKDKVKEFLKDDRSKYGIREETLLHGSYSDYVREFHRQKEIGHRGSSSSYYSTSYPSSSRYDVHAASADEFLRRTRR